MKGISSLFFNVYMWDSYFFFFVLYNDPLVLDSTLYEITKTIDYILKHPYMGVLFISILKIFKLIFIIMLYSTLMVFIPHIIIYWKYYCLIWLFFIFFRFFFLNFISKHRKYFTLNGGKNIKYILLILYYDKDNLIKKLIYTYIKENFVKIMLRIIFWLFAMLLVRIFIRTPINITSDLFSPLFSPYIVLSLSLPFCFYFYNIIFKYVMKKELTKEDYSFFNNKKIINNINIVTVLNRNILLYFIINYAIYIYTMIFFCVILFIIFIIIIYSKKISRKFPTPPVNTMQSSIGLPTGVLSLALALSANMEEAVDNLNEVIDKNSILTNYEHLWWQEKTSKGQHNHLSIGLLYNPIGEIYLRYPPEIDGYVERIKSSTILNSIHKHNTPGKIDKYFPGTSFTPGFLFLKSNLVGSSGYIGESLIMQIIGQTSASGKFIPSYYEFGPHTNKDLLVSELKYNYTLGNIVFPPEFRNMFIYTEMEEFQTKRIYTSPEGLPHSIALYRIPRATVFYMDMIKDKTDKFIQDGIRFNHISPEERYYRVHKNDNYIEPTSHNYRVEFKRKIFEHIRNIRMGIFSYELEQQCQQLMKLIAWNSFEQLFGHFSPHLENSEGDLWYYKKRNKGAFCIYLHSDYMNMVPKNNIELSRLDLINKAKEMYKNKGLPNNIPVILVHNFLIEILELKNIRCKHPSVFSIIDPDNFFFFKHDNKKEMMIRQHYNILNPRDLVSARKLILHILYD